MNRDDVIMMAREAGLLIPSFRIDGGLALGLCTVPDFERFATLVAAAEREACAAAPDLLEAAAEAERVIEILWASHHANRADAALNALRAAITKATGEQP